MKTRKVTLVCNLKNTFVIKDVKLIEAMGYDVYLVHSPPYKNPVSFFWNRLSEFILCLYYLPRSEVLFSWFNDYHATIPLILAKLFGKSGTIIVGGYDAIASPDLNYGIFLKKNIRQFLAKWNYKLANSIWVVHKSLSRGCIYAKDDSNTTSGILTFIPNLKTPIMEIPTAYNSNFWKAEQPKDPKTIITVANISDLRTFERKGIPLFLELAKLLPDFKFTLAGIENIFDLKYKLPKNVDLFGKQTKDELKRLYEKNTFYFQGSKVEGLPNVLCEAMLCECIPIGKKVFGIHDVIGSTGLLFESSKATKNIVSFLKENKEKSGSKARRRIIEMYNIEKRQKAFRKILTKNKYYG